MSASTSGTLNFGIDTILGVPSQSDSSVQFETKSNSPDDSPTVVSPSASVRSEDFVSSRPLPTLLPGASCSLITSAHQFFPSAFGSFLPSPPSAFYCQHPAFLAAAASLNNVLQYQRPMAANPIWNPADPISPRHSTDCILHDATRNHARNQRPNLSVSSHSIGGSSSSAGRSSLRRAVFSDEQRRGLEERFQIQKYISKPDRKKLADRLALKDSQVHKSWVIRKTLLRVKIWFQNRRMKWRNTKNGSANNTGDRDAQRINPIGESSFSTALTWTTQQ